MCNLIMNKDYTFMTEIDFEALGRCHHLRSKIADAARKRDDAFKGMTEKYCPDPNPYERVHEVDIQEFHQKAKEFELANDELTVLVNEYNKWAEKAGERPMRWFKTRY